MPQRLTRSDVERIATLARLELTDEQKDLFVRQLAEVLQYTEQIQTIDTAGVPPTSHVLSLETVERDDAPVASLSNADALGNAPDPASNARLFRVPRVIG